jgi:hypothetical protein
MSAVERGIGPKVFDPGEVLPKLNESQMFGDIFGHFSICRMITVLIFVVLLVSVASFSSLSSLRAVSALNALQSKAIPFLVAPEPLDGSMIGRCPF